MSFARRLIEAAETVRELNARTGSGDKASWSAADLDHCAGDFAAEEHTEGRCRVCGATVVPNDKCNISLHRDGTGLWCPASGQAFSQAVIA